MVLRIFKFARETAAPLFCARSLAVIACVAGLAGCENFSDFESGLRDKFSEAFKSTEKLAKNDPVPFHDAARENEVIVTLDRPAAKTLQGQLGRLGFRPGPVDGIIGMKTARAVKRYQAAHYLPVTGKISLQLLEHLEETAAGGTSKAQSLINLASDDFPTYLPGTSFLYSNGKTERVLSAKDRVVRWARGDGSTYSAHRNFLLPKSYWSSDGERGTAAISGAADQLWPVREGSEVSFSSKVTMQKGDDPDSTTRRVDQWRCRNDGNQNITVQAGTFETLVLICTRGADPASPEIVRTWYYSKTVRHYVRFVEHNPELDTTKKVDLVAIRPGALGWPPIMRAALARAVVHALEMEGALARMPWTSSGVNTRVTIKATSRFVADDGRQCRQFVQIWSKNGLHRHYPAVACKTALGKWAIPGLESKTANSLATTGALS
jgi:peptidoglycan hydrolase-like protein with peptidoglycan-binding domain